VQADVPGLRQVFQQRLERIRRAGHNQVVVVDEYEQLRARPPGPLAQLLGRDVGTGQAAFHVAAHRLHQLQRLLGLDAVPDPVVRLG
jgi:hypothetical protein